MQLHGGDGMFGARVRHRRRVAGEVVVAVLAAVAHVAMLDVYVATVAPRVGVGRHA